MTQAREVPVEQQTRPRAEGPKPFGECHYCGEPLKFARWCDVECRDNYERYSVTR